IIYLISKTWIFYRQDPFIFLLRATDERHHCSSHHLHTLNQYVRNHVRIRICLKLARAFGVPTTDNILGLPGAFLASSTVRTRISLFFSTCNWIVCISREFVLYKNDRRSSLF